MRTSQPAYEQKNTQKTVWTEHILFYKVKTIKTKFCTYLEPN